MPMQSEMEGQMTDGDMIRRDDVLRELEGWFYDPQNDVMTDTRLADAIRALPALPVQPVRVKPLEWRWSEYLLSWRADCELTRDVFIVYQEGDEWVSKLQGASLSLHPSVDAAKANGDTLRAARILAAIEPVPAPTLAEALKLPEIAALVGAFVALEKAASEVSKCGAQTGGQWVKLTVALLKSRLTLRKLEGGE